MAMNECCAKCLYNRQRARSEDPVFLAEVRKIIDCSGEHDPSPLLVYRFNQVFQRLFGPVASYTAVKKQYNDLVLSMEDSVRKIITSSADPLSTALAYARIGNYIDFGAMNHVDEAEFLSLFDTVSMSENDQAVFRSLLAELKSARSFLLLADNCGEIVLDKLFIEQLKRQFPSLHVSVMVRGAEALNDVTVEDAAYVGIDRVAEIVSNGQPIAGTMYEMLPEKAKAVFDSADVILSKGQGNYETLNGRGHHIFYAFLCKCALFTDRFNVPKLTGLFIEEGR